MINVAVLENVGNTMKFINSDAAGVIAKKELVLTLGSGRNQATLCQLDFQWAFLLSIGSPHVYSSPFCGPH